MERFQQYTEDLIDLGQASTETKGDVVFEIDTDVGQLLYLPGVVAD